MVKYCKSFRCLAGKTAIVTGANTGIGYETALDFAKRGCRVILACRNQDKAKQARDKIIDLTSNRNVIVKLINLELLESVRDFARDIIASEPRLDILVNNAGAGYLPEKITPDGLQLEMAVNYFSPFLLTYLLLGLMKKSGASRIVNVSSIAAKLCPFLDLNDLNGFPGNNMLYFRTKLCNILFTIELAKRLKDTGVTTYSLHPGVVHTEFQRYSKAFSYIAEVLFKTPEEGAQTTIYVSVQEGIEKYNGRHFEDCAPVATYFNARDGEKARKLWEITEQMVGINREPSTKFNVIK